MGYHPMSDDEVQAFLRAPVRPAMLATTRRDGRPHVAPVWYDVDDDGRIVFNRGLLSGLGRVSAAGGAARRSAGLRVPVPAR